MTDKYKNIPDWKADFPIKKREAGYVSRREFLKVMTFFSGLMAVTNVFIPLFNHFHKRKRIKDYYTGVNVDTLKVGEQTTFYINQDHRNPYMLIRMAENEWKVYEQKCTHLSCGVIYKHEEGVIFCPCHHGVFDADSGNVLQGPPPRPLPKLAVVVKGDQIYVEDYDYSNEIQKNHKMHH